MTPKTQEEYQKDLDDWYARLSPEERAKFDSELANDCMVNTHQMEMENRIIDAIVESLPDTRPLPEELLRPKKVTEGTMRLYAKDYSEQEIRAMQAGPLIDWLAWQATHSVQGSELKWFIFDSRIHGTALLLWRPTDDLPKTFTDCAKISTDLAAGMRAMFEIAPLLRHNVSTILVSTDGGKGWELQLDDGFQREYESEECPTPMLAIAKARALYARAKQIGESA